jgi:hypothetical protein
MGQLLGVSELVGIAQAGGSLKSESFRHSVVGAVGMAAASGKTSYVLGCELHRLRCAAQADRWKYAVSLLHKQVLGLARKERWRKSRALSAQLGRMSHQALQDWLFDLCVPCKGTGSVLVVVEGEEKEGRCDVCAGNSGKAVRKAFNMQERMSALGVCEEEYIREWDERFELVLGLLDKSYGVAQRAIGKRLARRVEDV